jgi:hypothetical protein
MQNRLRVYLLFWFASLCACATAARAPRSESLVLRTDSASVTVYHRGGGYFAKIGFTFINNSGSVISQAGCSGPGSPIIEKKVNGAWVAAYHPIYLLCRTYPDFTWEPGARVASRVDFAAFERGRNTEPSLRIDRIDGLYRLHWGFTKGRDAMAKGAKRYDVVSNEFQLILAPSIPQASNTR